MIGFSEKQIKVLRGSLSEIARTHRCSRYYVSRVLNGKVGSDTELTRNIKGTASQLLGILQPSEQIKA